MGKWVSYGGTMKTFALKLIAPSLDFCHVTEVYSKPCQTSKIEFFAKLVNGLLTIFEKRSVLNV